MSRFKKPSADLDTSLMPVDKYMARWEGANRLDAEFDMHEEEERINRSALRPASRIIIRRPRKSAIE